MRRVRRKQGMQRVQADEGRSGTRGVADEFTQGAKIAKPPITATPQGIELRGNPPPLGARHQLGGHMTAQGVGGR